MTVLSNEQELAFTSFLDEKNLFITGPAGTGKTYLIKYLHKYCLENNQIIQVCSTTGCSAVLLNCKASTIHSWAGVGIMSGTDDQIIDNIRNKTDKRNNWKKVDVLIIDEISMMSVRLFELLDRIGKAIRGSSEPFGGIQVVLCADFFQLSPIDKETKNPQYCFESKLWDKSIDKTICLTKIFRQEDERFQNILNEVRQGEISLESIDVLRQCTKKVVTGDIVPTKICPLKVQVDKINNTNMALLEGTEMTYIIQVKNGNSLFRGGIDYALKAEIENIKASFFAETLSLKVGAQVMLTKNKDLDIGLCNGSRGIVESFQSGYPIVKFFNGITMPINQHVVKSENFEKLEVSQVPLILAWAVTIHKIQGSTLDIAEINLGKSIFAKGQSYVALSRVKSLDGLYISNFEPSRIMADEKVAEFYKNLQC